MRLSIKNNIDPITYQCTSANRTVMGAKKIEFINDKVIELFFEKGNDGTNIFSYKLLGHNLVGTGLIHEWASDMEKLQEELIFRTDREGKIIAIENRNSVYRKWVSYFKDEMEEKYKAHGEGTSVMIQKTTEVLMDDKKFLNSFKGFNLYRIFFQGHYNKNEIPAEEEYNIQKYFGEYDLPLLLKTTSKEHKETAKFLEIQRKGELDKETFEQDRFTKMIKSLVGAVDIDARLNVEMEENYTFNKKGWITEAELYLKTHAANMYALANAHSVRMIDKNESMQLVKELREKSEAHTF